MCAPLSLPTYEAIRFEESNYEESTGNIELLCAIMSFSAGFRSIIDADTKVVDRTSYKDSSKGYVSLYLKSSKAKQLYTLHL